MNNCVGIGNHKLFLLFVLYIFLMCTYALLLVVARYAGCLHGGAEDDDEAHCGDGACVLDVIFVAPFFLCCVQPDPTQPDPTRLAHQSILFLLCTHTHTHTQPRGTCW